MSMKVMQNYHYLMQASVYDQNYKNVNQSDMQQKNCACYKIENPESNHKHFFNVNTYCKVENKELKIVDSCDQNLDAVGSDDNKKDAPESLRGFHTNNNYKRLNSENFVASVTEECSPVHSKSSSMADFYHKTPDAQMSSKLSYFNTGYYKAEMFAKRKGSKIFGKDIVSSQFFTQKNLQVNSKNYNLHPHQIENARQMSKLNRMDSKDASIENSKNLFKNQEQKVVFRDISTDTDNSNFNKDSMSEQRETEFCSKTVDISMTSKDDCSINSNSDSVSSFDGDAVAVQAKNHLFVHSATKLNLCDICKKGFSTKGNLQNHHIVHSGQKPHECGVCKKTFSQRSTLGKHYLIHTGEKPHICNICGRGFRQANNLRIHLLTHSGEKPHHCNICQKGFTQKIALQKHMLTHTGVKPHECDVCKRCFTTKGNLQKHFLTHTGEKPHICGICNRGFSQKIALKKHHLTHTGEKPFSCEVCGKRFTTKGNLKSHFKRHTRDKPSMSNSIPSITQSLLVPKSIAQSIMSTLPPQPKEQLSASTVSSQDLDSYSTLTANKSAASAFSPQIQHSVVPKNTITSSYLSSPNTSSQSTENQKSEMTPYYLERNEQHSVSLPSYALSTAPFNSPHKLSTTAFSHFQPQAVSCSTQINSSSQLPIVYSQPTQTLTNYSLPHYKQASYALLPPSLGKNSCTEEPLGLTVDNTLVNTTNTRASSPLQTSPVIKKVTLEEESLDTKASEMKTHTVVTSNSPNQQLQTSTAVENKIQHITVL